MRDDALTASAPGDPEEDRFDRTRFRTGDRVMAWMIQLFFVSLGVGVVLYFTVVWGWIGPWMGDP
jgi:hypothetical protein